MLRLIPFWCIGLAAGAELHVGAGKAHTTLTSAIAAASPGDAIVVHPGIYQEGRIVVDKSVTLTGVGFPVLDGGGKHEVLAITAPKVTVSGFELRNSGISSLEELAGIKISDTSNVTVRDNRVYHCNFGIYLSKSKDCLVTGNELRGQRRGEHDTGNGIHLWYCERSTVTGNTVRSHRDGIYLEFSGESVIEENHVEDNLR
jgi:nitrous oxidase accessory protein